MKEILIFVVAAAAALFGMPLVGLLLIKWTAFLATHIGVPL